MDTRLLTTFVTLARVGSFTSAAKRLHLAQSTVTLHIHRLERELQVRLFDRLPDGAVLTESGRHLLAHADKVLGAEAELRSEASSDQEVTGVVAVGATESLCAYLLPEVIKGLYQTYPAVDVQLVPVGTAAAVEQIRSGQLALALLVESAFEAPDIDAEVIGSVRIMFVSAPGHPMARRQADWRQLGEHRWFLLEDGCSYSDRAARELGAPQLSGTHTHITRLSSVEAIRACVAAGLGISLLPEFTVQGSLSDQRLVEVHGPPDLSHSIWVVRQRRRSVGKAEQKILEGLPLAVKRMLSMPRRRRSGR